MKLILVYNSECVACAQYLKSINAICDRWEVEFEYCDINSDIFNSIEHIVSCRASFDPKINQLPLLLFFKNNDIEEALTGFYEDESIEELVSKILFL